MKSWFKRSNRVPAKRQNTKAQFNDLLIMPIPPLCFLKGRLIPGKKTGRVRTSAPQLVRHIIMQAQTVLPWCFCMSLHDRSCT